MTASNAFVWADLVTGDLNAATAFYHGVFGWDVDEQAGRENYALFSQNDEPVAGVVQFAEVLKKAQVSPNWMGYLSTDDIEAHIKDARGQGGQVVVEPFTVPEFGTIVIMADPAGAAYGVVVPTQDLQPDEPPARAGSLSWHELVAADLPGETGYYESLFGWTRAQSKQIPMALPKSSLVELSGAAYLPLQRDGTTFGGSYEKPSVVCRPFWLHYFHVDNLEAVVERAQAHGARLVSGPVEAFGTDYVAHLVDPEGAPFGLHQTLGG